MIDDKNPEQQLLTHGLRTNELKPTPKWVRLVSAAAIVIVAAMAGLLWWSQHQVGQLRDDLDTQKSSAKTQEQNKALVDKVGELIILPEDETPTIATVSDLDKLKGQPFFANAELGDKVLIYGKAKKAILYRPSKNKIIELAPLSDNGEIPANSATAANAAPANTP